MKLLFQYEENRKIREIFDSSELPNAIRLTYGLEPDSYFLQKFDKDFEDFVDIEDGFDLKDKDKIKILPLKKPLDIFSKSIFENSFTNQKKPIVEEENANVVLTQSVQNKIKKILLKQPCVLLPNSGYNKSLTIKKPIGKEAVVKSKPIGEEKITESETIVEEVAEREPSSEKEIAESEPINREEVFNVVYKLYKQWPLKINLPVEKFSRRLQRNLFEERPLSWNSSRELIGHLANYAYSFKKYPNKSERLDICYALVLQYPYLRSDRGFSIDTWELKLLNKLKKMRQIDTSLEVSKNRCGGSRIPRYKSINPKKGEINWSPDHEPGETAESLKLHKQTMLSEFAKFEKYQDKSKIASLMALTYSFRREQINSKISVSDLKSEYPLFFQINEQFEEFERLTAVDIKHLFYEEVQNQGAKLYQVFHKKIKTNAQLLLLENFDKDCADMTEARKVEAQYSFGIFILPYLFKEDIDSIFRVVEDDDIVDYDSFPRIYINLNVLNGSFIIISEGIELCRTVKFIDAVGLLISFYYTLNIKYPPVVVNTLKFLQYSILKIRGGCLPSKVHTLLNKIK